MKVDAAHLARDGRARSGRLCRSEPRLARSPSRPLAERARSISTSSSPSTTGMRSASRAWRPSRRSRVAGKVMKAQADGRLAMVRPRTSSSSSRAWARPRPNIGSNDEEFWFWVQSDDDPSIYWCNYADLESSALAVTYQPDWIIEALGLKPITPEEAAGIKVERTDDRDTSALVFPPTKSGGETYQRMMIVSNYTRRIKEHRIYAGSIRADACWPRRIVSSLQGLRPREIGIGACRNLLPAREREARLEERPVGAGCGASRT